MEAGTKTLGKQTRTPHCKAVCKNAPAVACPGRLIRARVVPARPSSSGGILSILHRAYVYASDCCFWKHHISHGPAEGCPGEASPACVSHLQRSSTICIRMQLLRICCVVWPVDPPGLPYLRIVARAEWPVIRAAGAAMSHQSQLPGMATTPMQLQLLRHIALGFTSNLSMRAYSMVMTRVIHQ